MPRYTYRCPQGHEYDRIRSANPPTEPCQECDFYPGVFAPGFTAPSTAERVFPDSFSPHVVNGTPIHHHPVARK